MIRWFVTIIVVSIAIICGGYTSAWILQAVLQTLGFFTSAICGYIVSFISLWLAFFQLPSALSDDTQSKLSLFISTTMIGFLGSKFIIYAALGFSVVSASFVVLKTEANFPDQSLVTWTLGISYFLFFVYVAARVDKEVG
jgi:hypothetical protein